MKPQLPDGWRVQRNADGSVGIFAPPPRRGESQRTSDVVYPSDSRDLHELLGKLADHMAAEVRLTNLLGGCRPEREGTPMNYSQRKHLEHMMADAPQGRFDPFDPFGLSMPGRMLGLDVVTPPDVPRYTLPAELLPGVPWPPGFRDEFNQWSRSFLGTTNPLPRGVAYVLGGRTLVVRRDDVVRISGLA